MSEFAKTIYHILTTIPKGKVLTYGQLAKMANNPKATRAVGNILHNNPDPYNVPCFKVVNSKGKLAKHFGLGIEKQKQFLENDGIVVNNYQVDLNKYQWRPQ